MARKIVEKWNVGEIGVEWSNLAHSPGPEGIHGRWLRQNFGGYGVTKKK